MPRLLHAAISLLVISSWEGAFAQDYWTYLLHPETLAEPLPYSSAQFSSYDRSGGNDDYGRYYSTDADGYRVLCDTTGPGVVAHFWMTANVIPDTLRWKIYVDDMSTPLIHSSVRQLFGSVPPFESPLADSVNRARYSYVPIPFQERIKITSTHHGGIYYHFSLLLFPDDWTVNPLTIPPSAEYTARLDSLRQLFLEPDVPRMPDDPFEVATGTQLVPAWQTVTVMSTEASGTCRMLKLWLDQHTQAVNDSLWTAIYVDNYPLPVMYGPICSMFGAALGWRPYASTVTGMAGDSLYVVQPFPFRSALRVDAINRTSQDHTVTAIAEVIAQSPSDVRPFRLHSLYQDQTPSVAWIPYKVFDIPGPGNYIGLFWQMYGTNHSTLEGDERIYIDGASTPAWNGTGTEDYFNGAYFWSNGNGAFEAYQLASHGVLGLAAGSGAAYRWHVMDPVPFATNLRMTLETGGFGQLASNYRTSAMVFARIPRWRLMELSGDGALNQGESVRIIGYGLNPGATLSGIQLGPQPLEFLSGSLVVNADSILDVWVRAPFEGEGSFSVTALLDGQLEVLGESYSLFSAPRLTFIPRRLDMDTLVFRGDTIEVRCDGFDPGETATVMAAGLPLEWAVETPVADSTGSLAGRVTIPSGLPSGDLLLTASSEGAPDAQGDRLLKHRRYLRLEAELLSRSTYQGGPIRDNWAINYTPPGESYAWGRNVVRFLDGHQTGDSLNLNFSFADSGQFRFAYFFARTGGGAIVETKIDGDVDAANVDTYDPILNWRIGRMDTVYGEWRSLSPGSHVLTLKVAGRNPAATSWDIWFDQMLVLQEYPISHAEGRTPISHGYALEQNFPNPFNSSTQFRFTIPRTERITIAVYDLLGRETAVLADRTFEPGTHTLQWDCASCSSGIYFLRMSTPMSQIVRKAVVLR